MYGPNVIMVLLYTIIITKEYCEVLDNDIDHDNDIRKRLLFIFHLFLFENKKGRDTESVAERSFLCCSILSYCKSWLCQECVRSLEFHPGLPPKSLSYHLLSSREYTSRKTNQKQRSRDLSQALWKGRWQTAESNCD